jgi:hypothetical protein
LHRAEPERSPFVADATDRDDRRPKALVNAAKFATPYPRIAILAQQLNREPQLSEIIELFFAPVECGAQRNLRKGGQAFENPEHVRTFLTVRKKMPRARAGFVYLAVTRWDRRLRWPASAIVI